MVYISFWGSPGISARLLQSLIDDPEINVRFVVSQEDKPRSLRGRETEPTPVKALATKYQIPVFTPKSLKKNSDEFFESIQKLQVDANVVFAYGKLIPPRFIDQPSRGTLNFHASLLPQLRGASPIEHALFQDLTRTGWTMQKMVQELDAGDVYYSEMIPVQWTDDFLSLADKMMSRLLDFGGSAIKNFVSDKLSAQPQDENKVTHCGKIETTMGEVHWNLSSVQIRNLARGLSARGGIYAKWNGRKCRLFPDLEVPRESLGSMATNLPAVGEIIKINGNNIWVACGENSVLPLQHLQPEGKKKISAKDFVNGYRVQTGQRFD